MSPGSIITMIILLGCVWGGFIYTLNLATRREKEKDQD